jgi:hypothetical protein
MTYSTQRSGSLFLIGTMMIALFLAPALAIASSKGSTGPKKMGAGFVLMVSLQRNAG